MTNYTAIKNAADKLSYSSRREMTDSANFLLGVSGLAQQGWTFAWNNHKRSLGLCSYKHKCIYLSSFLVNVLKKEVKAAEVKNVILHEIAHALVPDAHHGPKWRAVARAIGCTGDRCYAYDKVIDVDRVDYKWVIICKGCGEETRRHRLNRNFKRDIIKGNCRCTKCGNKNFIVKEFS